MRPTPRPVPGPDVSRRALLRRASVAAAVGGVGLGGTAAGCAALPPADWSGGPARSAPPEGPGVEVIRGWQGGRREEFLGAFAAGRAAQALAARLWDTWRSLSSVALAAAGPDVIEVAWTAGGETAPATHRVRALASGAGVTDLVPEGPLPLWLREAVRVAERAGAVLVTPAGADPAVRGRWLDSAAAAVARLRAAELDAAAASWDGHLVVEVPAGLIDFSAMVTDPGQDLSGTAAVTRMDARDSGPRIVVNPLATDGLAAGAAADLLAHEGVHVATRSPWLAAPLWVVEGLAESVGAAPGGDQAARNRSLARAAVRRGGVPDALPPDAAFGASGVAVEETYALAEVAVEACLDRFGHAMFLAWVADWDGPGRAGDAELTAAYVTAARRLA